MDSLSVFGFGQNTVVVEIRFTRIAAPGNPLPFVMIENPIFVFVISFHRLIDGIHDSAVVFFFEVDDFASECEWTKAKRLDRLIAETGD